MRKLLIAPLLLLLAVVGCSGASTPAQMVFAAKSRYQIALDLADQYEDLPRCTLPDAPIACSDPGIVDVLRKTDLAADSALDNAEIVVRDPASTESALSLAVASAQAAVASLVEIVAALGLEE